MEVNREQQLEAGMNLPQEALPAAFRAAGLVNAGDLPAAGKILGLKYYLGLRELELLEALMAHAIGHNQHGESGALLEAVTAAFIRCPGANFNDWSHALCHNFEGLGRRKSCFFDSPHNLTCAELLLDEAVRRSKEAYGPGCMSRIVRPLALYNVMHAEPAALEQGFVWRPQALADDHFRIQLDRDARSQAFCGSKNLLEFLIRDLRNGERPFLVSAADKAVELLTMLREKAPAVVEGSLHRYLEQAEPGSKPELQALALAFGTAHIEQAFERGVFVDVGGTLLKTDWRGGELLNESLLKQIRVWAAEGLRVTIFTGGDPERETERLRAAGVDEQFLPAESKSRYERRVLEKLIDDTPAADQRLSALEYERPYFPD